jgi:hypothetical protein
MIALVSTNKVRAIGLVVSIVVDRPAAPSRSNRTLAEREGRRLAFCFPQMGFDGAPDEVSRADPETA